MLQIHGIDIPGAVIPVTVKTGIFASAVSEAVPAVSAGQLSRKRMAGACSSLFGRCFFLRCAPGTLLVYPLKLFPLNQRLMAVIMQLPFPARL